MNKIWTIILAAIFLGFIIAAVILLVTLPPRGTAIFLEPPPTQAPIMVYITGAVNRPGVVEIKTGSRLIDVINAAHGMAINADNQAINLARKVQDGETIIIPTLIDSSDPDSSSRIEKTSQGVLLDLNRATKEQLEKLPGIGPSKAEEIVRYRDTHGQFISKQDLMNVPGIGDTLFKQIQDLVTIR